LEKVPHAVGEFSLIFCDGVGECPLQSLLQLSPLFRQLVRLPVMHCVVTRIAQAD
jgi:hypothetical protein